MSVSEIKPSNNNDLIAMEVGETSVASRSYSLDVIKIIATVLIVFHHYQQHYDVELDHINFYGGKFYFGYIVELFFILSGYFMAKYISQIQDGLSFKEFYLKRFLRLFPLVALSTIAYAFLNTWWLYLSSGVWENEKISLWKMFITMIGIQDGWVFANPSINNPVWYISVLLLCYIVFYITCIYAKRKKIPVIYLHIFLILLGFGIQTYKIKLPFMINHSARGYIAFFWGVIFAQIVKKIKINWKWVLSCALIVCVFPVLIWKESILMSSEVGYSMTFFFYPALIILFLTEPVQKLFNHPWIGKYGEISFDIYIWHLCCFGLIDCLLKVFHWKINKGSYKLMFLYYIGIALVGTVSYFFFEQPCARKTKEWLRHISEQN